MEPNNQLNKVLYSLAFIIIVLGAVYLMYINSTSYKLKHIKNSVENVAVTEVDLDAKNSPQVPVGFPKGIPVDATAITAASSMNYIDRGVVLYNVKYTTSKLPQAVYDMYQKYMLDNGYGVRVPDPKAAASDVLALNGIVEHDTLSVLISTNNNLTSVNLVYTDKK